MHDCPDCGQACDCDQEDTWWDEVPDDCGHECDPDREDEFSEDW